MSFKPTAEQKEVMDYLNEQVYSEDGINVIVSGAGGTGKTTMICSLVIKWLREGKSVALTTMTGKATAVIRQKIYQAIEEDGLEFPSDSLLIETFSKITKASKVIGLTASGDTIYTNKWKEPSEFNFDILVIDELSMVPHWLSHWWSKTKARVFGFGDECQLPEVSSPQVGKELSTFQHDLKIPKMEYTSGYGIKVLKGLSQKKLLKVLRSDNDIAFLSADLRDFSMNKNEIVNCIKGWAEKSEFVDYSTSIKDIEIASDWQILAYKNSTCTTINNQLSIGQGYPALSDKIILLDNINPIKRFNGETMIFGDLIETIAKYNLNAKNKIYVCLKFQGEMPKKNSANPLEKTFFSNYVNFRKAIEATNKLRIKAARDIFNESGYSKGQIEEWKAIFDDSAANFKTDDERFNYLASSLLEKDRDMGQYFINHSIELPRLYMVNIDFGYCITTHKSQGSEYENVCYLFERFDKPLIYTGISRAKKKVKIINLTKGAV